MHEAELRLIEACQAGDSRAQRFIFERYYRLMFGVCLRYMSDKDSVKDVVQEGFLKVFNNIGGYTFKGSFEGWMRRIMVNTAIDAIRRKIRRMGARDEQSFEPVDEDGGWEMEEEEGAAFTVHDVLDAMEHLTPMYRTVFNLYVFDNLGHQEISDRGHQCWNLEVELGQGQEKPSNHFVDPIRKHPPCRVNIHLIPSSSNSLSNSNLKLKGTGVPWSNV